MIISGTGSRQLITNEIQSKIIYSLLLNEIKKLEKVTMIISGMAEGFDELLANAAVELNLPLTCAIPNREYLDYYWRKNSVTGYDRYRYAEKLCRYAESNGVIKYICKNLYVDGIHANFVRNNWMVENCEFMFVYNPVSRGTKHCYEYIQKIGRKHKIIEV